MKKLLETSSFYACVPQVTIMRHGSWDTEHDWQNRFVILDDFLPFYPTNNPKNQNFEKMKKRPGDIIILHNYIKNHDNMLYYFLPFYPLTTRKIKIFKNSWKYHHFTHAYQKLWSYDARFLRYSAWEMNRHLDRWMDRQKKWHIEVGALPKNSGLKCWFCFCLFLWQMQKWFSAMIL